LSNKKSLTLTYFIRRNSNINIHGLLSLNRFTMKIYFIVNVMILVL